MEGEVLEGRKKAVSKRQYQCKEGRAGGGGGCEETYKVL